MDDPTTVTFHEDHVAPIQAGEKTSTIRWQFEHDLEPGDPLRFVTASYGDEFAQAETVAQGDLRADWISFADFSGRGRYWTTRELLDELSQYYPGREIQPTEILTMLFFRTNDTSEVNE